MDIKQASNLAAKRINHDIDDSKAKRPKRDTKSKVKVLSEDILEPPTKRKSKRFRCVKCRKQRLFSTQKLLDRHILQVHEKKSSQSVICEICSMCLKSEVFYKRHMKSRHPETPRIYTCDFEGRTFTAKDYLRIHMDRHRLHQILTCTICQKSYISKHTFRKHLKMHIEKHVCSSCGLVFSQKSVLENHYASKHSEDLPFSCYYCTRMFPNKTARNNHHYIAHKKSKSELNFKCNECNVYFEMKEELRIHSFIHFEGEIKTCLECNQIFKTNRLLRIHMQKHETKKSFQCASCGDYFTFKTGLAKHIRLNRCKGPSNDIKIEGLKNEEIDTEALAQAALIQLKAITRPSKRNVKKETNVMRGIKDEPERSESEAEDDFKTFFEPREDFIKTERPETKVTDDTKQTRKNRSKKSINPQIQIKIGRPHLTYTCDYCGDNIKFKKEITEHLKKHTIFQRYKCSECPDTFKSRNKLVEHSLEVHGVKIAVVMGTYACEICDRKFDIKSTFESHKLSHDENSRNHVCKICLASFKSVGNLRRHEAIHVTTRDFHCYECTKSFKTQIALKIHNEAVHPMFKVFVNCSICKAIIQEKHLKTHIKNQHTEEGQEKPYSCGICSKTFRTEKLGQRHYESVHEPKSQGIIYECPYCPGVQFFRQRDLKEHSFIHFKGPIHQCEICLKMFKDKRLLTIHSAVHSEVPTIYACQLCENVKFKTRGGRRKHMMKQHSETAETTVKD